jgi:NAD+ synthase (glutamine-hydrolysing)
MQHLIRWVAGTGKFDAETSTVLEQILEQEISPELVPVAEGERPQSTEEKIGPYSLQDFTLFQVLRYGFPPSRIAFLAQHAWCDRESGEWPAGMDADQRTSYDLPTIRHWLEVFLQRFFAFSQFKRSALPNGPKVTAGGSLSPRGDWRAPADGNATVWLEELRRNVPG